MKYLFPLILLAITLVQSTDLKAQDKPKFAADSEIYLFNLSIDGGLYSATNPRNISKNDDYDSQPYFLPSNKDLLFASSRDGKQTDIYQYDISTNKLTQLTHSPHNEFSPKPLGNTGKISYVSEGNNPYQSIWQLDLESGKESWQLNSKEPVGYYQINEPTGDVLFWSRYGWNVHYLNPSKNVNRFVMGHALPSSPQLIPNSNNFSFVHRQTNGMNWIKAFDPTVFSTTPITPLFDDNYEYTWSPNGDIVRLNNGKLSIWTKDNKSFRWVDGQDISEYVKGKLARIAISSDGKYLAVVATN